MVPHWNENRSYRLTIQILGHICFHIHFWYARMDAEKQSARFGKPSASTESGVRPTNDPRFTIRTRHFDNGWVSIWQELLPGFCAPLDSSHLMTLTVSPPASRSQRHALVSWPEGCGAGPVGTSGFFWRTSSRFRHLLNRTLSKYSVGVLGRAVSNLQESRQLCRSVKYTLSAADGPEK